MQATSFDGLKWRRMKAGIVGLGTRNGVLIRRGIYVVYIFM